MWLWYRPATTALIIPLAWKPPYAMGAALKKTKEKRKKKLQKFKTYQNSGEKETYVLI